MRLQTQVAPEIQKRLLLSRVEAESLKERDILCPTCGFRIQRVFSDATGHLSVKCQTFISPAFTTAYPINIITKSFMISSINNKLICIFYTCFFLKNLRTTSNPPLGTQNLSRDFWHSSYVSSRSNHSTDSTSSFCKTRSLMSTGWL